MSIEHLIGRHFRLQQELAIAYSAVPWNTGHIDRLTDEMARTEREISSAAPRANVDAAMWGVALPLRQQSRVGTASSPRSGAR